MKKKSYTKILFEKFWKSHLNRVGVFFVLAMVITALFAPFLANNKPYFWVKPSGEWIFPILQDNPEFENINFRKLRSQLDHSLVMPPIPYSPTEFDLERILEAPSQQHWMGTDDQGRDVAARMVHGARVSLSVGFVAVAIYVVIGLIMGSLAGYFGGRVDLVISRLVEVVMCFPTFLLILSVLAFVGTGLFNIMVVIGVTGWTGIARLVRGEFLKLRDQEFVISARALGVPVSQIIMRHILPNSLSPVLVSVTFGIASAILVESSLSFLGFGVQPPTPSWGDVLSQSRSFMDIAWWLMFFPGMAIFVAITAFNLVGEGLRDAVDPRNVN